MKVVFILEHFYPYIGGVEKLFLQLTKKLVLEKNTVRVVTTRFDKTLPQREIIDGVEVIRLNLRNRYIFTLLGVFFLKKYVKDFDIIHTTSYNAAFPAFFIGLSSKKKCIVTFHEYWGKLWNSLPYLSLAEKVLFSLYEQFIVLLPFHKIIAVSRFTKSELEKRLKRKDISYIYNGIEYNGLQQWHDPKNKVFTFTFYGRLGVSKGIDIVLAACEHIKKENASLACKMIIPKVPKAFYLKIKEHIAVNELDDIITVMHDLSDNRLEEELLLSDCVVVPSYSEGFCFAAAETVGRGIPLISSQKGALKEVVSGTYLVLEEMSGSGLYKTLLKAKAGEWIKTDVKRFELQNQIDEYMALYKKLQMKS